MTDTCPAHIIHQDEPWDCDLERGHDGPHQAIQLFGPPITWSSFGSGKEQR